MVDYERLYFELFRGTERAIRALEEAQRRCEELYLSAEEDPARPDAVPTEQDDETKD